MRIPEEEKKGYKEFRHFATQFASAISHFEIDDGQWVGRLLRVYCELEVPDGTAYGGGEIADLPQDEKDKIAAEKTRLLLQFLRNEKVSDLAISDVTYEIDSDDPEGLHYFARGFIDIKQSEGKVLVAGRRYSFEHRIKKTYHSKKTVLKDAGPIPQPV